MQQIMKFNSIITLSFLLVIIAGCSKDGFSGEAANDPGSSATGSLSRFITAGNYLYVVDNQSLKTFDVSNAANPVFTNRADIGFEIQTITTYNNYLFIGSGTNMYIYGLADPKRPNQLGQVQYIQPGKDPIIVKNNIAYSTVRQGNFTGRLSVVDVQDIFNPVLVNTLTVESPYGLGYKNNGLFICCGEQGLRVYNIANPTNPLAVTQVQDAETYYDVIVKQNLLVAYIKGGLALYDISNEFAPALITKIKN